MSPDQKAEIIRRIAWDTYSRCLAAKDRSAHVRNQAAAYFLNIWMSIDAETLDGFLNDLKRRGYTIHG